MNTPSELFDLYESYLGIYEEAETIDSLEYVLDYLIDEGFTDSYEGANEIVECMSDEWLEGIIEGFVPLSPEKEERVRDEVEQNVVEREAAIKDMRRHRDRLKSLPKPLRRFSRSNKAAIEFLNKYDRKPKGLNKKNLLQNAQDSLMHTSISRQASNVAKQNELKRNLKDLNASVDYVLDYLIDEGFTDSYESAIAIVESMSDEWLEGIIEKFNPSDYEEYHKKNHQDEADDRSEQRDKEYLDYLDSKKDIRDPHNEARGVRKKRGSK
jgi:hypothetical protein